MIHFAILDDHPLVVEGIRSLFHKNDCFELKWGVTSTNECLKQLQSAQIDALLLDIHLEDSNGIEFCKQLKQLFPALHILMLTSYCETMFVKSAMQNGASGFLLKNAGYAEISQALQVACEGGSYLSETVKQKMLDAMLHRRKPSAQVAYIPKLTRRETEVLRLIVDEHTNNEIADKLFVSLKTVETHRMNLLQKLGVKNTAGLVKSALELELI